MGRYQNLYNAVSEIGIRGGSHLRFLEVGTFDGVRACQLLRFFLSSHHKRSASYWGFDLFEDMTPEMVQSELSKSKLPPSQAQVTQRMSAINNLRVQLFKGNTRETLKAQAGNLPKMDLIFIDGGHSLETIASDWDGVKGCIDPGTIVLFDDYYENRDDYGCKNLVETVLRKDPAYRVQTLDPVDVVAKNGLNIRMVELRLT